MAVQNTAGALFPQDDPGDLIAIAQASAWASRHIGRNVTLSNISYLIQYGRINKYSANGTTVVSKQELANYYDGFWGKRESSWKKKLGDDLNWRLSFENLKEKDTTKHVHRLHPYKGKFIPQLVEYFLDEKTDDFKKRAFFRPGDVVLDPFCGSGAALVQANELGLHAVGIDVSAFNALISNVKVSMHNFGKLQRAITDVELSYRRKISESSNVEFERALLEELNRFNSLHCPAPDFRRKVAKGEIDEKTYCPEKESLFMPVFRDLVKKYGVEIEQAGGDRFMDKWFLKPIRSEIDFLFEKIKKMEDDEARKVLGIILSRTVRSCRATTHADLGTLKRPVTKPYYCRKHGKICKPLFSAYSWWRRYSVDTIKRLHDFEKLRTNTDQICLQGDSRTIDLIASLSEKQKELAQRVEEGKIKGIFTSPPYVGLIDYHEQHAYAYDLLGFDRNDELEIGPLFKGQGVAARKTYIEGIAEVLRNCRRFLVDDFEVFLVANDKHDLYPSIAELAGMRIVDEYKRPVLNRTERSKAAYSETIFHLRG